MEIDTDEILDARLRLSEAEDDLTVKKQAKQCKWLRMKMAMMLVENYCGI